MKKANKFMAVTLTLSLVLTGCSGVKETVEKNVKEKYSASAMTVKDIKQKYGTESNTGIMPMYNVEPDKEFIFTFPYEIGDINPSDMISVHTDIKGLPESQVFTLVSEDYGIGDNKTEVSVKSGMAVLPSNSDMNASYTWGNAPIYYIRINYDLESSKPQKLETPIIVPFTIKSELPVPNLRKEISPDGRLKLVWDKVEGATEYKIYNVSKITLLETTNEVLSGAETGYKGIPRLETTVTETEFMDFLENDKDGLNEYQGLISGQNMGVSGDYYVTAVAGDKESNFSIPVSTATLSAQLPLEMEDNINFNTYESVEELPKTVKIKFIDGSFQNREVIYDVEGAKLSEQETELYYTVKGTAFKGYVLVKNMKEQDKSSVPAPHDANTGFVEAQNDTDDVPKPDVPTIIETKKDDNKSSKPTESEKPKENKAKEKPKTETPKEEPSKDDEKVKEEEPVQSGEPKEEPASEPTDDVVAEQVENTKEHVEEGNKEEVDVPEISKELPISADSALEEYLALKMINAETKISLKAFPEAQNYTALEDAFKKVIYQNPMILGVNRYMYDYSTLTLTVEYDESAEVIKQKQQEIVKEANKIVSSVVKSSMSDEEKRKALYDYLNDHTKYDDEALKNAEQNNFQSVDESFTDSFTTYGIMVEKNGVCQSYAMTYKMLLNLADVEAIVVTGTADGVPHAWNKVKIDNEWLHTDNTNNGTNVGIPYMVYESNDTTVESLNFLVDKDYWIDGELGKFAGKTDKHDYYVANDLIVDDINEFKAQLTKELESGKTKVAIRMGATIDEDTLMNAMGEVINKIAPDKLYSTRYGMIGDKFLMIQTE